MSTRQLWPVSSEACFIQPPDAIVLHMWQNDGLACLRVIYKREGGFSFLQKKRNYQTFDPLEKSEGEEEPMFGCFLP